MASIRTQDVLASLPYLAAAGLFVAAMVAFRARGEPVPYKDLSRFSFGAAYALATLLLWKWHLVERKAVPSEGRMSRLSIAGFVLLPALLGVALRATGYLPTADVLPSNDSAQAANVLTAVPNWPKEQETAIALVVCSLLASALLYALRVPAEALLVRSSVLQRERLNEDIRRRFRRVLRQTAELQAQLTPAIEVLRRSNGAAGNEVAVLNSLVSRLRTVEGRDAFWRQWDEDGSGRHRKSGPDGSDVAGLDSIPGPNELERIRKALWALPEGRREKIRDLFLRLRTVEGVLPIMHASRETARITLSKTTAEVNVLRRALTRSARRAAYLRWQFQEWQTHHRSTHQWLLVQARIAYAITVKSSGDEIPPLRMAKGGGA